MEPSSMVKSFLQVQEASERTALPVAVKRFMRVQPLSELTGIPVSTIWQWARTGRFPMPVKLGPRLTAWDVAAVADWQASRAAASTAARN
jgi:prophage regulatory protein